MTVAALAMALTVSLAAGRSYAADTLLGVASHGALAAGLVALSFMTGVRVDLMGYLFGDILAVTRGDLAVIFGGAALVVALLAWRWRNLLLATLNEDLAASAGVDPRRERLILTLALALLVAVALKVVGVLLVTAMLIVPAAAARGFARTPEAMAAGAVAIGAARGPASASPDPGGSTPPPAPRSWSRRSSPSWRSTRWRGALADPCCSARASAESEKFAGVLLRPSTMSPSAESGRPARRRDCFENRGQARRNSLKNRLYGLWYRRPGLNGGPPIHNLVL